MHRADVAIIGGGIVGTATAWRLLERFPDLSVCLIEKEHELGRHQTGRNSGVLHSGIYYRPGTLRAANCRAGMHAMREFCKTQSLPFEICGKVIVAVNEEELPRLEMIRQRGEANGVACELIGREQLRELEPHVNGLKALYVREAGITDFRAVCLRLAELVAGRGATLLTSAEVLHIQRRSNEIILQTRRGKVCGRYLITCAGLHADRVTRLTGQTPQAKVLPFRGEYFDLLPAAQHLCRNLIYPVPDPRFPFLGVHFTRMIRGGVECGPNAVLAFKREGYSKASFSPRDLAEALTYPGFLRMAARYWRTGLDELWRSFSKPAFVKALQRLIPEIREEDLTPAPAGVRAQAIGHDGTILDDFVIQEDDRIINVLNAPSPAATASLNVGKLVVDAFARQYGPGCTTPT